MVDVTDEDLGKLQALQDALKDSLATMLRRWLLQIENSGQWDAVLNSGEVRICTIQMTEFVKVNVCYSATGIRATAFIKREKLDAVDQG